jgi:hypothetical protein
MDITTLDRVHDHLDKLLSSETSPSQYKNGLLHACREVQLMRQTAEASLTLDTLQTAASHSDLRASLRVVTREDGMVVAITLVDAESQITETLWELPLEKDASEPAEPPGRYHIHPTDDGWFEVCDTAARDADHPLGEVVGRFRRRELAWTSLLGLNLDSVTRRKVEYLMATPRAKPVGMILVAPNMSRAYVDMGRVEWNTIPRHNPMSIRKGD